MGVEIIFLRPGSSKSSYLIVFIIGSRLEITFLQNSEGITLPSHLLLLVLLLKTSNSLTLNVKGKEGPMQCIEKPFLPYLAIDGFLNRTPDKVTWLFHWTPKGHIRSIFSGAVQVGQKRFVHKGQDTQLAVTLLGNEQCKGAVSFITIQDVVRALIFR